MTSLFNIKYHLIDQGQIGIKYLPLIPTETNVNAWMKQERQNKNIAQGQSEALCFSFYSIFLAVGNPVVDYFSLDVERAELLILKSIPWNKVNIKVSRYFQIILYDINCSFRKYYKIAYLSVLVVNISCINSILGSVH